MGDGIQKKFALIINGDTEARHLVNVDRAIKALRAEDPSFQVAVVSPKQPTESVNHYQPANQAALKKLIAGLKADDDDLFVLYVTGHGGKGKQVEGCAELADKCYALGDLQQALAHLQYGRRIVVMDTCKSGGGLGAFANPRSIVVTVGSKGQNVRCQEFSPHFWGDQVPDRDGDGIITVGERYAHALQAGKPTSLPQFYEAQAPLSLSGKVAKKLPFKPEVVEVNDLKGLKGQLKQLEPDQRALVMFSADWCEVCKKYAPKFKELARQFGGRFLMIRAEGKNGTEEEWKKEFGITSVPFVAFIDSQGQFTPVANQDDPLASLQLAAARSIEGQRAMYRSLLTHSDPHLRVRAMQMLLGHGTTSERIKLTPILGNWLEDPNGYVSNFAGNALTLVASWTPVPELIHLIDDPEAQISVFAQIALKMIASRNEKNADQIFEALLPKIHVHPKGGANLALKTIASIMAHAPAGEYRALKWKRVRSFLTLLRDKDPKTCVVALRTLMDEDPSDSSPLSLVIRDVMDSNSDDLGRPIIDLLLQALKDSPELDRPRVIQLLNELELGKWYHYYSQHPNTISQLIDLLNNPNHDVRHWSASVLNTIDTRHYPIVTIFIINNIIPSLKNDNATVRGKAVVRLASIAYSVPHYNIPKVIELLSPLLQDPDLQVRESTEKQFDRLGVDVDAVKLNLANEASRGHIGLAPLFTAVTEEGAGVGVQLNGGYRFPYYWSVAAEVTYQNHPQIPTHRISASIEPRVHFFEQPKESVLGLPNRGDPYISLPSLGFTQDIHETGNDVSHLTLYPVGIGLNWYFSEDISLQAAIKGRIDIPIAGSVTVQGGVDVPIGAAINF